jgi:hypothetical protein
MVNLIDFQMVGFGFGTFAIFLIFHFITFRFLKAEQLFKGIITTFLAALVVGITISLYFLGWQPFVLLLVLSIYALAAYVYILCFFGPYETSIRMRLIRELSNSNQGLTLQDLLKSYNTAVILDTRLKRLTGAGDLTFDGEKYHIAKQHNAFFIIDAISKVLHEFIHRT